MAGRSNEEPAIDGPAIEHDERPSDAVLDELLRAFAADDPSAGADIDLDSPEVEALLTGDLSRPTPAPEPADTPEAPVIATSAASPEPVESEAVTDQPIKISAEDDPPDPIYVEGDLEPAAATTTVFIDDGTGDIGEIIGSAEAERATGIEPKLRQRRIAVRRAEGRKRLRWVALAVAVVVVLVAGFAVLGSSLFSIDDVSLTGAVNSRGDALDAIVADLEGEAVLRVDTDEFERRIEAIPWVERARVTTSFPSAASIEIRERRPTATFQGADGRFRVIDVEGRVLDVLDGQPVEYVLVSTDEPPDTRPGEYAPAGFAAAGLVARVLTPTVRPLVDSIVVAADGSDVRLLLDGGTEVLLGDSQFPVDKLVRLETVINTEGDDLPARIDVSTDEVTVVPG